MSQYAMMICKSSNRDQFNWPWKLSAVLCSLCWCAVGNWSGSTTNHLGSSLFKHSGKDLPCTHSDLFGWAGGICTASQHRTRLKAAFLRSALSDSVNTVLTKEPLWLYTTASGREFGTYAAGKKHRNRYDNCVLKIITNKNLKTHFLSNILIVSNVALHEYSISVKVRKILVI